MTTSTELRQSAARIRQIAHHSEGGAFRESMASAASLERRADSMDKTAHNKEVERKRLVKLVKTGQKALGLYENTYRDLLVTKTGVNSAGKMTVRQLADVVSVMRKKGFTPLKKQDRRKADDPQSKKIRSLWLQLRDAGKVRDSSEKALVLWACKQFKSTQGIEDFHWLQGWQKSRLIESLKKWLER